MRIVRFAVKFRLLFGVAALASGLLLLSGCGDSTPSGTPAAAPAAPEDDAKRTKAMEDFMKKQDAAKK